MAPRRKVDWARLRHDYETTTEPATALAGRYGLAADTVRRRARRDGWQRSGQNRDGNDLPATTNQSAGGKRRPKQGTASRATLIKRLYRTIDRKLAQLEQRMEHDADISSADHERETRAIGQLIRNLEQICDLEAAATEKAPSAAAQQHASHEDDDAQRLRLELAERIVRLRDLGGGDG